MWLTEGCIAKRGMGGLERDGWLREGWVAKRDFWLRGGWMAMCRGMGG